MQPASNFVQMRQTIALHLAYAEQSRKNGHHYRLDRAYASAYFAIHEKWREKISTYLYGLQQKGKPVVHIDICGRAHGFSLGATRSYCFCLNSSELYKMVNTPNHILYDGDIFNAANFAGFLKLIKQGGTPPALVTFEPVAGLQSHGPCRKTKGLPLYGEITYHILGNRLRDIIKLMRPGGYIYIERPFQFDADSFVSWYSGEPKYKWKLVTDLRKITKKYRCTTALSQAIGGPYVLVRTAQKNN